MSMNRRIKELRKSLNMNQKTFGTTLGLGQGAVSWIEKDGNTVTEQNIKTICAKFNISEEWLRTGKEPMHKSDIDMQVDAYTQGYTLDEEEREIIRIFLRLDPKDRAAMIAHVEKLGDAIRAARPHESTQTDVPAAKSADSAANHQHTMTDEEIEAEVEAYRAALIAEKEAASASSSTAAAKMA